MGRSKLNLLTAVMLPLLPVAVVIGCRSTTDSTRPMPAANPTAVAVPLNAPTVARLFAYDARREPVLVGSAICVDGEAGLFATCAHLLERAEPFGVQLPNDARGAYLGVVAVDEASNLAVFRVGGDFTCVPLVPSQLKPEAGERLLAVGSYGAMRVTMTHPHGDTKGEWLVSAPELGQGASGGAVVDAGGNLVGVLREAPPNHRHGIVVVPAERLLVLLAKAQEAVAEP